MDDRLKQLLTLGREHYENREYERAEHYLMQVLERTRSFADVHNMLGVIFHDAGKFAQAQAAFEEALAINPRYTEAALNLAVTYNDLGKYQDAKEVYSRAMAFPKAGKEAIDPFAKGKLANMHADLGQAYADVGLMREAVLEFRKALELCPGFADLRTRLGNLYRDAGDLDAARHEYEEAKRVSPKYAPARVHLGIALLSAGKKDEALKEWEEVLAFDPDNRMAQMYLRMVKA